MGFPTFDPDIVLSSSLIPTAVCCLLGSAEPRAVASYSPTQPQTKQDGCPPQQRCFNLGLCRDGFSRALDSLISSVSCPRSHFLCLPHAAAWQEMSLITTVIVTHPITTGPLSEGMHKWCSTPSTDIVKNKMNCWNRNIDIGYPLIFVNSQTEPPKLLVNCTVWARWPSSNYLVCLDGLLSWPAKKWAWTFPRRGQLEVSLKFDQRCMVQKNINALSTHVHKSLFQEVSLPRSAFLSHLCLWVGVKGIRPFWFPWLHALFWLGLIVKSVAKKKGGWGGVALLAYDGGENNAEIHQKYLEVAEHHMK